MIQRAFRYRLYPTPEQAERLEQTAGVVRLIYNLAWEQRRDHWRQFARATGRPISWVSQSAELTDLRAAFDWIGGVSSTAQTYALRELDRAFQNFFSGRARFPTPRRKGMNDGFRFKGKEVRIRIIGAKWAEASLPKIGSVRFRVTRAMRGDPISVSITRDALGWHVCFGNEIEHDAPANDLPPVGIDRGIANTLALSTGELLSAPDLSQLERRKKRAQRILARRKRGSCRYRKQRRRVAAISAKIARCRADWQHRVTTDIARRFGLVAIDLRAAVPMPHTDAMKGIAARLAGRPHGHVEGEPARIVAEHCHDVRLGRTGQIRRRRGRHGLRRGRPVAAGHSDSRQREDRYQSASLQTRHC